MHNEVTESLPNVRTLTQVKATVLLPGVSLLIEQGFKEIIRTGFYFIRRRRLEASLDRMQLKKSESLEGEIQSAPPSFDLSSACMRLFGQR
ncbi:hypothetical protein BgiBS90_009917 [Biomphalaria glabrata]|nr:hypothetical protein BgiBS90_009917 [Biomphalaria glabrata]